jgi:hypothetical protein
MLTLILLSAVSRVVPCSSTLSKKWHYFWKKFLNRKFYFDFLCKFSLKYFSFCQIFSKMLSVHKSTVKVAVILVVFLRKLKCLSTNYGKILQYHIKWKSVHWKPNCSMPTDRQTGRQTDITNLIVAFCNFAKASKNETISAWERYVQFQAPADWDWWSTGIVISNLCQGIDNCPLFFCACLALRSYKIWDEPNLVRSNVTCVYWSHNFVS